MCAKCGHGMCPDWCAHSSAVSPDGRTEYFCYCCRTPHWAKEQPYTDDDRKLGQNTAAMTKEVRDFTRAREAQKALCPKLYPLTQERQDQLRLAEEWPEPPPWIVRISNMYCCYDEDGDHNPRAQKRPSRRTPTSGSGVGAGGRSARGDRGLSPEGSSLSHFWVSRFTRSRAAPGLPNRNCR